MTLRNDSIHNASQLRTHLVVGHDVPITDALIEATLVALEARHRLEHRRLDQADRDSRMKEEN